VRIWNATTGDEIVRLLGHQGSVQIAAFARDGTRLVTASSDKIARIWDAATGVEIAHVALDSEVTALSVRGNAIAFSDRLGLIKIFDAKAFIC
jgi:WD40 repeat protein